MFILLLIIAQANCLDFVSKYRQNPALQIQLPEGLIQGKLKQTVDIGLPYYSYEGIPYAKPPVGNLRFKAPEAPEPWPGVLDANGRVPSCIQIPTVTWNWYESEDCLYINVYSPRAAGSAALLPVMVWIYGGGFLFGVANSTYYGPDHLLSEDVVVVHFNYRVNVFGFLSTADMASPGNYGLKDQVAALEWVRKNIHLFGGDPDKVTIFGESAGGISVQYHLLSERSRGLFRAAISQSGSALCAWGLNTNPRKIAYLVGLAAGFTGTGNEDLVTFLRGASTQRLKRAAHSVTLISSVEIVRSLPFSPTLEPHHPGAFITERSYELLQQGKFERVPHIIGFTSQESAGIQKAFEWGEPVLRMVSMKELLVPPGLQNSPNLPEIADKIHNFYFSNAKSFATQYLNFISDSYFYRPITQSARLYSIYAPIYMYRFSYEGYFLGKRAFSMTEGSTVNGVMHAEEIWYIFARSDLTHPNTTDKLIRQRMVRLWTNFAKNPTPATVDEEDVLKNLTWPEFKADDSGHYLDISAELMVEANYKDETMKFWRRLFTDYGIPPFDTY